MQPSKAEKFNFYNSLICLAKALTGKYTIVDLRNDASVTGKINFVDGYMNIEMEDVVFYNPRGNEYVFSLFFIHARNIRYIHIPPDTSAMQLMENELLNIKRPSSSEHPQTLKTKRARRYHQDIVASLSRQK